MKKTPLWPSGLAEIRYTEYPHTKSATFALSTYAKNAQDFNLWIVLLHMASITFGVIPDQVFGQSKHIKWNDKLLQLLLVQKKKKKQKLIMTDNHTIYNSPGSIAQYIQLKPFLLHWIVYSA